MILLLIGIAFIIYIYAGYPLFLWLATRCITRSWKVDDTFSPTISVILPVYNGKTAIQGKLDNILKADYDPDKIEVIVVSDGSTDGTENTVTARKDHRIKLVTLAHRSGKTEAINRALKLAVGDILIFTDLHTRMADDALPMLVRNFADPSIGAVSSQDRSLIDTETGTGQGEGTYVRYEMSVRRMESSLGSITGVSGCLYAIRRSLVTRIPKRLVDDLYNPLEVVAQGLRVVAEPEATAYVPTVSTRSEEFRRRVRTASGGIQALWHQRRLFNPFRFGLFSFELTSHKLLRLLAPFIIAGTGVGSIALIDNGWIPKVTVTALGLVLISAFAPQRLRNVLPGAGISLYLVTVNAAIGIAWIKLAQGDRFTVWEPSQRRELSPVGRE